MWVNIFSPVYIGVLLTQFILILVTAKMNNKYDRKHMTYATEGSLCKKLGAYDVIDTGSNKWNISGHIIPAK